MKVIDGKHYVDGGPKCDGGGCVFDNCEGTGIFKIYPGAPLDDTPDQSGIEKPCPACHGTGFQAVEEWPDAVKAAWLAKNCRAPLIQPGDGENSNTVITTTDSHQRPYFLAEELNFSAALTAAVIAVAEEAE